MSTQLSQLSGWSALVNGFFAVLGAIFLVIFFMKDEPFGTLNDLTSLPWVLAFLPGLWLLYRLGMVGHKPIGTIALVAGVIGLLGVFILQLLLVLKVITIFQQTYYITSAYGAIGIWMVIASQIGRAENFVPPALGLFGIALGIGWILAMVCVWIGGFLQQTLSVPCRICEFQSHHNYRRFADLPWIFHPTNLGNLAGTIYPSPKLTAKRVEHV